MAMMTSLARQKTYIPFSTSLNRYNSCDLLRFPLTSTDFSKSFTYSKSEKNNDLTMVSRNNTTFIKKESIFGVNCLHIRHIPFAMGDNANSSQPMAYRWAGSARTYIFRSARRHQPNNIHPPRPPYKPSYVRELLSRPIRKLSHGLRRTGGRSKATGHITARHRGGGASKNYRIIDFHRKHPAVGVVERVEYDPCRSSRIALVRWMEGIPLPHLPPQPNPPHQPVFKVPSDTPIGAQFSLSTLPGKAYRPPEKTPKCEIKEQSALIGLPPSLRRGKSHIVTRYSTYKYNSVRDCFLNAFVSKRKKNRGKYESRCRRNGKFFKFPRFTAVGAKPAFYAARRVGRDGRLTKEDAKLRVRAWKDTFSRDKRRRDEVCWKGSRKTGTVLMY